MAIIRRFGEGQKIKSLFSVKDFSALNFVKEEEVLIFLFIELIEFKRILDSLLEIFEKNKRIDKMNSNLRDIVSKLIEEYNVFVKSFNSKLGNADLGVKLLEIVNVNNLTFVDLVKCLRTLNNVQAKISGEHKVKFESISEVYK